MRTATRWLAVGLSAALLIGGALTVAAATQAGARWDERYGLMRGDVDRIRDRDQTRLRDESCLEVLAIDDGAVPRGDAVMEQTRTRERERANRSCGCLLAGEMNWNNGAGGPQLEREHEGAGPNGSALLEQRQEQTQAQGGNTTGTAADGGAGRGGA